MMDARVLRHHVAYNEWATLRILTTVKGLSDEQLRRDFGTADKDVVGTLAHVCASERIWLARIREGTSNLPVREPGNASPDVIFRVWPEVLQDWRRWADELTDKDGASSVAYTDLRGRSWTQPLWQIVFHAVNHSTHHRGQVSGFLRAMGHVPPALDFILFVREGGQQAPYSTTNSP